MPAGYFSPVVAVVQAGDTVTWTNQDSSPHSVVSYPDAKMPFDIDVEPGQEGTVTFTEPGIYRYYSDLQAKYDEKMAGVVANEGTDLYPVPMRGVIVVLDQNGTLPASGSSAVDIPADTMQFTPWSLVVPAGTQVTWTNHDGDPHAAASVPDYATAEIPTQTLTADGGSASVDLQEPGIYYYYCPIHASWDTQHEQLSPLESYGMFPLVMDGLIVVTP